MRRILISFERAIRWMRSEAATRKRGGVLLGVGPPPPDSQRRGSPIYDALAVSLFVFACSEDAAAQGVLRFESDEVLIYSGPGQKFRPIGRGKQGAKAAVNPQMLKGADGGYFEIVFSDKPEGESEEEDKRLGYVSTRAKVTFVRTGMDEGEDLKKYKSWSQAESGIQSDVTVMKDQSYLWTVGYLKYPSPGFFVKGFVGQILSQFSSSTLGGGELGLDQWLRGPFTTYCSLAVGPLFVPSDGTLFTGSQLFNLFLRGNVGVRYSPDEHAQLSLGLSQILVMNVQNSFMSPGFTLSLEVGL